VIEKYRICLNSPALQIGIDHQRKASEDPLQHHPGDEIEVRKGIESRAPFWIGTQVLIEHLHEVLVWFYYI